MNHKTKFPYILVTFLPMLSFFLLISCTTQPALPEAKEPSLSDNTTIDIFAAHGFLGGSSYERYYLRGSELFRECGNLKEEPNPSPSTIAPGIFSTHPSVYPKDGSRHNLNAEENNKLHNVLSKTINQLNERNTIRHFGSPQSPFRLAQGGIFEIKITTNGKTYNIKTSLNDLSSDNNNGNDEIRQLFTTIRSFDSTMCDNQVFFGIGRN